MRWKRGLSFGALLWVFIFFEVSFLMFGLKLLPGVAYYLIHYALLTALVVLCSWLYFRDSKARVGLNAGGFLGVVFVLMSVVLDAVITIPLFEGFNYMFFFRNNILFSYLLTIIACAVVGRVMGKGAKKKLSGKKRKKRKKRRK
jgi:hypothetical protein